MRGSMFENFTTNHTNRTNPYTASSPLFVTFVVKKNRISASWLKRTGMILICLALLLLSSCARIQGKLLIMEGNFFTSRGFYTEAISSYLRALAHQEFAPYAEYGLAVVYFALGESAVALERYRAAMGGLAELGRDDPELRHRIYYNMGIIYFEKGEYSQAVSSFRSALIVDGSRIDAKRNLELSLLVLDRISSQQPETTELAGEGTGGDNAALFAYIRQMEQEQWRNREWASEDDWYGPDY
ncbi:MAG: tetratricopeptide repeat protein [Treponema sp.]|nr:tetratricopeptide repeat protein [Treponema sp.]